MEEAEKHTIAKPTSEGVHASTCLVDESCIGLVHSSSPHNFISYTSFGNEYWVKVLFFLVPHEEKEDPTFFIDGCRDIPCDATSTYLLIPNDIEKYFSMAYLYDNIPF